jgi:hypothetical protein
MSSLTRRQTFELTWNIVKLIRGEPMMASRVRKIEFESLIFLERRYVLGL